MWLWSWGGAGETKSHFLLQAVIIERIHEQQRPIAKTLRLIMLLTSDKELVQRLGPGNLVKHLWEMRLGFWYNRRTSTQWIGFCHQVPEEAETPMWVWSMGQAKSTTGTCARARDRFWSLELVYQWQARSKSLSVKASHVTWRKWQGNLTAPRSGNTSNKQFFTCLPTLLENPANDPESITKYLGIVCTKARALDFAFLVTQARKIAHC